MRRVPCLRFGTDGHEELAFDAWYRRKLHSGGLLPDAVPAVVARRFRLRWLARVRLSRRRFAAALGRFSFSDGIRTMATQTSEVSLNSIITCPKCRHSAEETMPTDACQWFYECTTCKTVLKPLPGDCCVYCSYGTVACPPIQEGNSCCAG